MNSNPPNPDQNPDDEFDPNEDMNRKFQEEFGQIFDSLKGSIPGLPQGMSQEDFAKAFNPEMMGQMFAQVQAMFSQSSSQDGPVNWDNAKKTALEVAKNQDSRVSEQHSLAVDRAFELADLWLNQHTSFEAPAQIPQAWTSAEWIGASMDMWRELTEPVAVSVSQAMGDAIKGQIPEDMMGSLGGALPMLENLGGMMFSMQLGQAMGKLSGEVLGTSDIGLPIAGNNIALLPNNVADFAQGLEISKEDIFIYLALRESAYQRLFSQVPWLNSELKAAMQQYAAGFKIDVERIEEIAQQFDPMNPETMNQEIEGSVLRPADTPEQKAALKRLEIQLALIEGWVDDVVGQASQNLPSAEALRETMRRRRATGGPSERAFGALVGLELRPRRLREAANLWAYIRDEKGPKERDNVWQHPDLQPTEQDLDDPTGYFDRASAQEQADSDFNESLKKLLDGGFDENPEKD